MWGCATRLRAVARAGRLTSIQVVVGRSVKLGPVGQIKDMPRSWRDDTLRLYDNDIVIVALVLNLRCESLWLIAAFGTNHHRHQRLAPVRHSYCWMRHHRLLA